MVGVVVGRQCEREEQTREGTFGGYIVGMGNPLGFPPVPTLMRKCVLLLFALTALTTGCPVPLSPTCEGVTPEVCSETAELVLNLISRDERDAAEVLAVRPTQSSVCNDADAPVLDVEVQFAGNPERSVITVGRDSRNRMVICTY